MQSRSRQLPMLIKPKCNEFNNKIHTTTNYVGESDKNELVKARLKGISEAMEPTQLTNNESTLPN